MQDGRKAGRQEGRKAGRQGGRRVEGQMGHGQPSSWPGSQARESGLLPGLQPSLQPGSRPTNQLSGKPGAGVDTHQAQDEPS